MVVGVALLDAHHRFQTSHQSSQWSQAANAAEAGVELALMSAQKSSWIADGWSAAPGAPGTAPVTKSFPLSSGVSGVRPTSADVSAEKITLSGTQWLRVRSTGRANLSGSVTAGADARDVLLRKLSLRQDRVTGASMGTTPQATRTIEVLAEPEAPRPFKNTFVSKELFDIRTNTTSDSYDSSDAAKSNFTSFTAYGVYDAAKRQQNGDVGTTDPLNDWNFNLAHIRGDVLMPTTTKNALATTNVRGSVTKGFTFDFPDEVSPAWMTVTQNHGVVSNVSKTIVAGTKSSPTRHKFTSIELTGATRAIRLQNPVGQTESWVEIWVVGDVKIDAATGTGIKIDPGVHATIHFGSKVEIKGGSGAYGLSNESKLPANLIVRAYGGSSGANQDFILANTDFWGVVSAPWYKVSFQMTDKHVHGSFLAWQFDASDGTHLHYDEALANLALPGTVAGYSVRSWVEAVR
jgi:hypothetical protein